MKLEAYAITHEGRVRGNNEDNYFLCGKYRQDVANCRQADADAESREEYLYAVCDGMGGEEYGELASWIAVRELNRYFPDFPSKLNGYVQETNRIICNEIRQNGGKRIGTTFAALDIRDGMIHISNIGDSRVYMFRENRLIRMSKDHTMVQRLVDMKVITKEQVATRPERHKLTQHFGIFDDEMIIEAHSTRPVDLRQGDVFLLCSDGLTDMVSEKQIAELLTEQMPLDIMAESLLEIALEAGGKDNVTVLLVRNK